MTSPEFTTSATDRASKILSFDSSGELSVTQELGTFKGNWAASTAYVIRDIVKDTSTNNIFIAVTAHTSSGSEPLTTNTDSAKWSLIVDAASATTASTTATTQAGIATTQAGIATTKAGEALSSKNDAETAQTASETAQSASESARDAAQTAQAAAEAALDTFDDRFLGAKASDPTVDNDGNALIDGALYFDTTNDIMKVYDLTNTTWRQLTLTSSNQTNVNTVAGQISPTNNIATVAGADTNIGLVAGSISNVNTTASNIANVNSVAGNESNINSAVSNESNINAVVSNASNINSVAGNSTNINSVAGSITNVNTVATNISSVNSFANTYRIASEAPVTSLDVGDLYFDTTSDTLKVYGASGWQSAGSSVNGTSQRYHYDISGTPTSVTGADANGNTLTYDAGYVDVYVNGVRMSDADITVTSGDTVTFTEALANGDEVDIVGYGTFSVANLNADNLDSGTVPSARVSGAYTGITTVGQLTFADNEKAIFGAGSDLQIYHEASDNSSRIIENHGSGNLYIGGNNLYLTNPSVNEVYLDAAENGTVRLYYDNSAKLATTSTGIQVTGNIANASGDLTLDVAGEIVLDADGGNVIFSDAGTTFGRITNTSSDLAIKSDISDKDIIFKGNDGGSIITALTLNMSDGGTAQFNEKIQCSSINTGSSTGTLTIFGGGTNKGGTIELSGGNNTGSTGSGIVFKTGASTSSPSEKMRIDQYGHVTMPNQPAFQVNPASNQLNMANGDTLIFAQEKFDQNSDFSSNTFTAPVTGRYQLQLTARIDQLDRDANWVRVEMVTSNRTYEANIIDPDAFDTDPDHWSFNFSVLADMDANDTVFLRWGQSGGSNTADLDTQAHFSGYLVC